MKILTVIPIAKGIPRDELSYFSAKPVTVGTLVTAPFGKRTIKGVVIDQNEVRDLKSSIKSSDFALRNITTVHPETLPSGIFSAAQNTARFYAQNVGPLLETIIPSQVFEYYLTHQLPLLKPAQLRLDIQAFQVPYQERVSYYKTLIRENLGRHASTMIIVPTVAQAEKLFSEIKTGIEDRIIIAHSKKTKKHTEKVLELVMAKKDPVVVVATAPFATLVRNDWHTVILEAAGSSHYRYEFSPIFDLRFFVEEIAKSYGARLIYADTILGPTIRSRVSSREIIDARSTWHIAKPEQFEILDVKVKPFALLHPKTKELIQEAVSRKSNSVFLTTRKGLAPITSCSDCGTIVSCPICATPLVLHRKKNVGSADQQRIYLCHHCLHTTNPIDTCSMCGSWRLTALGISTDGISQELETFFPELKTFICDGDNAKTPSQIQKILSSWKESPGSALIATPMVIPLLEKVDFGCIVSMDSLLSMPSYTSGETSLHTALSFLEKISVGAILQTRTMNHEVIQAIHTENIFDFMKNEIETRNQFGYPPSKILLKVSLETKKDTAKDAAAYLEKVFASFDPDILMKKSKLADTIIVQAIMKVDPTIWKNYDHDIHQIIYSLGREWKKEVNSDSVL
jgi:primosomal protein N'